MIWASIIDYSLLENRLVFLCVEGSEPVGEGQSLPVNPIRLTTGVAEAYGKATQAQGILLRRLWCDCEFRKGAMYEFEDCCCCVASE